MLPEGATGKPRTSSLLKSMALDTVTLEDALRLLTLPRTLGELDGDPVTALGYRSHPRHAACLGRNALAQDDLGCNDGPYDG